MELVLHPQLKRHLRAILNNPGGSHLFFGPSELGKFASAHKLASQLCQHPADIIIVDTDKASHGIGAIHHLRQQLQLKSARSQARRVAIIRDAEKMTREAQNALLKLLEEPPVDTTMILTVQHVDNLLPTVMSRCRKVEFNLPPDADVRKLVDRLVSQRSAAERVAKLAGGRPGLAVRLVEDEEFRQQLITQYQRVKSLLQANLSDKLQKTKEVTDAKEAESLLLKTADAIRLQLRQQPAQAAAAARRLSLLESLTRYLAANGSPKLALDKAILELSL